MNLYRQPLSKRMWRLALIIVLVTALFLPGAVQTANAGKEGVFLSDSVYFTLEEARLSPGETSQNFRFTLELVNNSDQTLNYNSYGAAVLDGAGNRYTAELTGKMSSRIKPGTAVQIKYVSRIPAGVALADLKTEIFRWNFSSKGYMDAIGALSVASSAAAEQSGKPQTVINLNDADAAYSSDALAAVQLEDSLRMLSNGMWYQYVHLTVENLGTGSYKLPSALQIQLKDRDGLTYTGTVVFGGDQTILPHQSQPVTVQFPVGYLPDDSSMSLEFGKKATASAATSGTTSNQSSTAASASAGSFSLLGSVELPDGGSSAEVLEEQAYPGQEGLKSSLTSVGISNKSTGVHLKADWKLENKGAQAVALPALSALYQLSGSTLGVAASDSLSHDSYLAPGQSTTFRFEADLPSGVDLTDVQLAVQEKKGSGTGVFVPVFLGAVPADGSASSGAPVEAGGDVYSTSAGKLQLNVKSAYRLLTESGDDVVMAEVQVENRESSAIKLPALAAVLESGDVSVDGKAVRIQSSAYLNPGQKTVLYFYAKVPYNIPVDDGAFTIGEGSTDAKTGATVFSKEWAKLTFSLAKDRVVEVNKGDEWFITDSGRQSTAKVMDSKLYDTDTGKIAAVRILQKNQEPRTNAPVAYSGYFLDGNGSVWSAKATEETGRVNKDGWSVSTLWVALPDSVEVPNTLVFGPKLDDTAFVNPHQVESRIWSDEPVQATMEDSAGFTANLAPYRVTLNGMYGSVTGKAYIFNFHYKAATDYTVTDGSFKNRSLVIKLQDGTGKEYTTWTLPIEGSGSLQKDKMNQLSVDNLAVTDMMNLLNSARLTVYDKFEGGTRLLGTITVK